MVFSEAAKHVIDLGRKIRSYYDSELPKRHKHYPLVGPGEEEPPAPPEEKELQNFLASLSEDLIYQLMLIQYLGRGEFATADMASRYEFRKDTFGEPAQAMSEMIGDMAILADELEDGLGELTKHKIDVDKSIKCRSRAVCCRTAHTPPLGHIGRMGHIGIIGQISPMCPIGPMGEQVCAIGQQTAPGRLETGPT